MLSFKNLSADDKQRRYRILVKLPAIIILIGLLIWEANYIFYTSIVTSIMIINLFIIGILSNKKRYNYKYFSIDFFILTSINLLSTLVFTPIITSSIKTIIDYSFLENQVNLLSIVISVLLVYLFWYLLLTFQRRMLGEIVNWKWRVTGFFTSTDLNFE